MDTLWQYVTKNWEMLVAFATAVGGALAYLDLRRRELSWKRTEFIFEQAKYLDSDREIAKAVGVLTKTDSSMNIEKVFGPTVDPTDGSVAQYRASFDKLLNLLDWFAYATFDAKSVSLAEVANFGCTFARSARVSCSVTTAGTTDFVTR